jgi:hypothetical protein
MYADCARFAHTGKRGRPRKPVLEPHPELVYVYGYPCQHPLSHGQV